MKRTVLSLVVGLLVSVSTFACDLDGLLKGNTTLAHKVRSYERQGYELVMDQSSYTHYNYLVQPTAPYVDGSGTVTLRRSAGGYSLTTEYITISFEGLVKKHGPCATKITDETKQTVY